MALDPEIEKIINSIQNSDYEKDHKTTPIDIPAPESVEIPLTETEPTEEPDEPLTDRGEPTRGDFDDDAVPKISVPKEKKNGKKAVIIIAAIAAAVLVLGAIFFSQVMYVKRYEAKYKVSFPKGIPQEFCDAYGKNQTLAGSIDFRDNKSKTLVYSEPPKNCALLEKGSDFGKLQHYRAVALSKENADIESMYKDADSFTKSSQYFTFKTVMGEKEKYQVIAAYITNTDPKDDNGYAFPYNCYGNFTKKSYRHYADTIKCRSIYTTGYNLRENDYCLTVSVPTDIMPGFRFVIVGVKTDKVKKIGKVKENARVRYPQAYCDKIGIHNIYNFAYKWYPEIVVNNETGETKQLTEKDFK